MRGERIMARIIVHPSKPWLAAVLFGLAAVPARGDTVLTFQDVLAAKGSDVPFFDPIQTQGFTLTATNPPTGFSAGFEAHGPSSPFYAGEVGIVAFAPATSPPDNVIELTQTNGQPFDLVSIDLARNSAFDPAPTVTFTGTKAGGGTVMESFTVTVPSGTAAFQTFDFTGFAGLTAVTWGQPQLSAGLHQFSRIDIASAVPEPSSLLLLSVGLAAVGGVACHRRRLA
jgi:PEP-CTERM motif